MFTKNHHKRPDGELPKLLLSRRGMAKGWGCGLDVFKHWTPMGVLKSVRSLRKKFCHWLNEALALENLAEGVGQ